MKCKHEIGPNGWCVKCQWAPRDDIFPAIIIAYLGSIAVGFLFFVGLSVWDAVA